MEIARRLSAMPVYRQALGESFAEIIERHTRSRDLLVACHLAKDALNASPDSAETANTQREIALAAIERVLPVVE
jgi:hypothetical protein